MRIASGRETLAKLDTDAKSSVIFPKVRVRALPVQMLSKDCSQKCLSL